MTKKFDDVCISQGMIDLDELNFTKDAQAALKKIKDAPEPKKNGVKLENGFIQKLKLEFILQKIQVQINGN